MANVCYCRENVEREPGKRNSEQNCKTIFYWHLQKRINTLSASVAEMEPQKVVCMVDRRLVVFELTEMKYETLLACLLSAVQLLQVRHAGDQRALGRQVSGTNRKAVTRQSRSERGTTAEAGRCNLKKQNKPNKQNTKQTVYRTHDSTVSNQLKTTQ